MMFTVVGCSFRRFIASKSGVLKMYAISSHLPVTNSLFRSVYNRQIKQHTLVLTILVSLNRIQSSKNKNPRKIEPKFWLGY